MYITPLGSCQTHVSRRERARGLRVIIERMKLRLLADKFFSGSLDGGEVRQVELEGKNGILSCGLFELLDRTSCFLLVATGDVHFSAL